VQQQQNLSRLARRCRQRNVFGKKWPRESCGQQQQRQATQQQQPKMFELAATRHARRGRTQEHQRTERHPLAGRPADQVKHNRPGDGQSSQQKPWREEIHVLKAPDLKAPSSKLQAPEKLQTSNSNARDRDDWSLELDVSVELGAWSLELLISGSNSL